MVASNNESELKNTLLQSPDVGVGCQILIMRGFTTSGAAYNQGLTEAASEIIVFAHQDVYLPSQWKENLNRSLQWLAIQDPQWGVLGVFGIALDSKSEHIGHCYSTGLQRVVGLPFTTPVCAQALDELVLIVRRSSGLRFDEKLPGFHLYGTDICLQSYARGMKCYIVPAFCFHNSNGLRYLPWAYWRSYFYMREKWWNFLPIQTCCSLLSQSLRPVVAQVVSDAKEWILRTRLVGIRCDDATSRYKSLIIAGIVREANPAPSKKISKSLYRS